MKKYSVMVLSPYVRIGFSDGNLYLGFGSLQKKILNVEPQDIYLEAAAYWKEPKTVDQVLFHLKAQFSDSKECEIVVDELVKGRFLIDPTLYDRSDRFSRHFLYYSLSGAEAREVQSNLSQKHVAILGSGGIGNLVAVSLATMGVGKLTLVDGDIIETSNLSRQFMFEEKDVEARKVDVLRSAIQNRISSAVVETIFSPVTPEILESLPKDVDLLVLSADTIGIQKWTNQFSVKNRIPFINIGYIQDIAVFGPFVIPGKTGCYACQALSANNDGLDSARLEKIKKINQGYQAPSIGPINMMAASFGVLDILKYLGEFGTIHSLNKRIGVWTHNFKVEEQACGRNPNCSVCSTLE